MEIIVQGTKGGYKVLFQTPNAPFSIARDVRRIDRNDGNPIGESAYSIALAVKGCAFTKYVIVRDVERAATGNIAFSVYTPCNERLSGSDIKSLLDNLTDYYCRQYADNNNLGNVREDWSFIQEIAKHFYGKIEPAYNFENYQQGTAEAAFVYYSSDDVLCKYFDTPYLQLYNDYKQIFFVEENLEDKPQNPLKALRHNPLSNLTKRLNSEKSSPSFKNEVLSDRKEFFLKNEIDTSNLEKSQTTHTGFSNDSKQQKVKRSWLKENKEIPVIIAGIIAVCVVIFNSIKSKNENNQLNVEKITQYAEGVDLNLDTLKLYKTKFCLNSDSDSSMWQLISSCKRNTDKTECCTKIENAIAIRNAINLGNIDELKKQTYSSEQEIFKKAIYGIKDAFKDEISQGIKGGISKMNLKDIGNYIIDLQKLLKIQKEVEKLNSKVDLENRRDEINKGQFIETVDNIRSDIRNKIDAKIQNLPVGSSENRLSSEKKTEVVGQSKSSKSHRKESIALNSDLEKDFWLLIKGGNVTKESYDKLFDNIDYKNEYKNFYNTYLNTTEKFRIFKDIDAGKRTETETLDSLKILIELEISQKSK